MHYLGSKKNHAKAIIEITCAGRAPGQWYVEPFCGGGNVINKVPQADGPRLAGDFNKFMVALLDAVGNRDWVPPKEITFKQYLAIRNDTGGLDHPYVDWVAKELGVSEQDWDALVGFAGTGVTFGSQWMSTYVHSMMMPSSSTPSGAKVWTGSPDETICMKSRKAALTDAPGLKGIKFKWSSFAELEIPDGAIVYCDPPYRGTAGYLDEMYVDHPNGERDAYRWSATKFWQWADALVDSGHKVYVSEYSGPPPEAYGYKPPPEYISLLKTLSECRALTAEEREELMQNYEDPDEIERERDHRRTSLLPQVEEFQSEAERATREERERWRTVWEKEVSVNYASQAGASKKETERLFHRAS